MTTAACPDCGARLRVPAGFTVGECPSCGALLAADGDRLQNPGDPFSAAFQGTSWDPERRGRDARAELNNHLREVQERYAGKVPDEELERYLDGYRGRYMAWLGAMSRTLSPMITGPSKFPTERNRKRLETEHNRLTELIEWQQKGLDKLRRIAAGKQTVNISDAGAEEKLTQRRAAELSDIEHMKAANALYRKLKGKVPQEEAERQVRASLPDKWARNAFNSAKIMKFQPDSRWYVPFADYELTNARARAKRDAEQAEAAAKLADRPTGFYDGPDGISIEDDAEAGRVRIVFPGKPDAAMIERLKARGFRWAPSSGGWQRQRTDRALWDAGQITGIDVTAAPIPARRAAESEDDARERVAEMLRRERAEAAPPPPPPPAYELVETKRGGQQYKLFNPWRRNPAEADPRRIAERLRGTAAGMQDRIDELASPAISRQTVTARRARIAEGMSRDSDRLAFIQKYLNALADAWERGDVPSSLRGVTTRAVVEMLLSNYREFPRPYIHRTYLQDLQAMAKGRAGQDKARREINGLLWLLGSAEPGFSNGTIVYLHLDQADVLGDLLKAVEAKPRNADEAKRAKAVRQYWYDHAVMPTRRLAAAGITTADQWEDARRDLRALVAPERHDPERQRQRQIADAERALIGLKIEGYFPTPPALAARLVEAADIRPGQRVLEPSAGKGNIADAIRAAHPDAHLSVIEISTRLGDLLRLKGFNVVSRDFLSFNEGGWDRIVMNPPFEGLADIDHVRHAYELLAPGGRLVSITSPGPFFREDRKAREFRAWFEGLGGDMEALPDRSFATSERPTGVATRLIVLDKPAVPAAAPAPPPPSFELVGTKKGGQQFRLFNPFGRRRNPPPPLPAPWPDHGAALGLTPAQIAEGPFGSAAHRATWDFEGWASAVAQNLAAGVMVPLAVLLSAPPHYLHVWSTAAATEVAYRRSLDAAGLPIPRAQSRRRNPTPAAGAAAGDANAEHRYQAFHGVAPHKRSTVDVGEIPQVWWKIGDLDGGAIEYVPPKYSERAPDIYRHEFGDTGARKRRSRAKLLVSGDGKWLLIPPADFRTGGRGIVG